ncbi:MAG: glycoside hydrolase family 25 protein [Rhizobiaceae bacterium]|nr:glycoside hydrolase family 25 protein [Rhizobiaceae bacterium]
MSKRLRYVAAGVLLLLLVPALLYLRSGGTFPPDREKYPVRGIDVSHHQGPIDWKRVAADDVAFAIMKATEGGDHLDTLFAGNLPAALKAGLAVGAYHFFTFCRPGAEQAQNFIATVPRDPRLLPPAVDIEFHGNCPERPSPEKLREELMAFLAPVEAHFGKPAVIYLPDDAAERYGAVMPDRTHWVRSLTRFPERTEWIYWQYSDKGRVDGIEGDVDLNVFGGNGADFQTLLRPDQGS